MPMDDPRARAIKTPRMIPFPKTLSSWRDPSPPTALPSALCGGEEGGRGGGFGGAAVEDNVYIVKIARCPNKAVLTAAIAQTQLVLARSTSPSSAAVSPPPPGASVGDPEVFLLPEPKALPGRSAAAAPAAGAHPAGASPLPFHAPADAATSPCLQAATYSPEDPTSPPSSSMPPAMALPPSVPSEVLETAELYVVPCRSQRFAETLQRAVIEKCSLVSKTAAKAATEADTAAGAAGRCEDVVVGIVPRHFPNTSTVVVKGLPLSIKHDKLWEELLGMASPPSYIRFHRNDRGLFKNIVYVKFPSKMKVVIGRIELERMTVGGRQLRVELKKPKASSLEEAKRAEDGRREDLKVISLSQLEQQVQDLARSVENEGMSYPSSSLTGEEKKYLKGLCEANDMTYESSGGNVTVKRRPVKRPSPSLTARTPPFHPATPATQTSDMEFRGIKHWREQRMALGTAAPGVMRPKEVGETAAWGSGRGRPVS